MAGMMKGFQRIMAAKVKELKAHGNKTASGKTIKDPEAYIAAGLKKTGEKKYGKAGFKARQKRGRKRAKQS